jgi:hypothetical protein
MAYVINTTTILDSQKRTVIKIVGSGNPDVVGGNLVVNASSLNGYIPLTGISNIGLIDVRNINYSISNTGTVQLFWFGANSNATLAFLTGSGSLPVPGTDGYSITNSANGATGDIWLSTTGFNTANAAFTVILDMKKQTRFYNPGTLLDPAAFNKGSSSANGH